MKSKRSRRNRSKLADKRVNTLIEKRIQEIARKEDRKNERYYVEARAFPDNVAAPAKFGVSIHELHTDLNPVVATNLISSVNSVDYWALSDLKDKYKNGNIQSSGLPTQNSTENLEFRVRQAQAFLSFYNENLKPYQVCAAIVGIPNANQYTNDMGLSGQSGNTTDRNRPNRSMLTKNNWKFSKQTSGIFSGFIHNTEAGQLGDEAVCTDYHIFDRKTVTVPGSGPEDNQVSNPKRVVHMQLNKIWKNPKKLYTSEVTSITHPDNAFLCDNYNIYLVIGTNCSNVSTLIGAQVLGGLKFTLGSNTIPVIRPTDPI